jgi:hypothetical protein
LVWVCFFKILHKGIFGAVGLFFVLIFVMGLGLLGFGGEGLGFEVFTFLWWVVFCFDFCGGLFLIFLFCGLGVIWFGF